MIRVSDSGIMQRYILIIMDMGWKEMNGCITADSLVTICYDIMTLLMKWSE